MNQQSVDLGEGVEADRWDAGHVQVLVHVHAEGALLQEDVKHLNE